MIEIIVGVVLLATSSAQSTVPMVVPEAAERTALEDGSMSGDGQTATVALNSDVPFTQRKAFVESFYKDKPILSRIAYCESTFRHEDMDGNVTRGVANRGDVGVMQINEYYHADAAKTLGLDIYDLAGNLYYARWLYEREGTTPWNSSSPCWKAGGGV